MNIPTYLSGTLQVKAYRILRSHVYNCLSEYDLNPSHWSLLGIVVQADDGVRLAKVAELLGFKAPLITLMANELIDRNLIKRIPHHSDARAKLLVITPEGKHFVAKVEQTLNAQLRILLKGLSMEDMATYHKVLVTIIENDSLI